jgi:formyltetrahydrofolate deformylase
MELILTLQCQDQPGIVNAITSAILECSGNIVENQQFTDPITNDFVMRTKFDTALDTESSRKIIDKYGEKFKASINLRESSKSKRALILVSKESHCLRDLLYLKEIGELPIEIPLVLSNHDDLADLVKAHGIQFEKINNKDEAKISEVIKSSKIEFLILARFMQILSPTLCNQMSGKIINIHHSFLPGFKGAKPYHQAFERGVKIIGATAHFVTADLDEGPIIEQDVSHVTHAAAPDELVAIGRDIERRVLSKAVKLFAEDRIFQVANRTIVFQ